MQPQELQRIRMLQNRMRRPSKLAPLNEESLKSIKSTDSKKIVMPIHKLNQEQEDTPMHTEPLQHIRLSEEEIRVNKKITDYFQITKVMRAKRVELAPVETFSPVPVQAEITQVGSGGQSKSPTSPEGRSRSGGEEGVRDQVRGLREALRERDQLLVSFRAQIVDSTVRLHRIKRNQLRMRVNHNKFRLGQFSSLKSGAQQWIDGADIRDCKQKLDSLKRQKDLLDKSKRQARRGKDVEESEEWKITLSSQAYFLTREEAHFEEMLRRLDEEKGVHIKEYRLLYQEDSSRYGRQVALGTHSWPLIRKYQLLGLLGRGGFSEVYKAFDVQQLKEVAVKVHEFNPKWNTQAKQNYIKHAIRENMVHKILSHPNIVRLYDTVEIDPNSFCTVLEYCEGPDLSFYLKRHKRIQQKQAKLIIRQVVSAIRYLHELPDKVIHYDLKPQNILFHKGRVKITDFGLCKTTKQDAIELTSQGVGTYWYLPPECFSQEKGTVITPKVDVWSIGVIYFEMLYGEKPFGNAMSQMRILKEGIMLKANSVTFPNGQKNTVSQESKDFIKECLEFKAQQRLDIRGVANHRLFQKK